MTDICLVSMPYGVNYTPSLGLGQLIAGCKEKNLSVKGIYASLWFAEKIGIDPYNIILDETFKQIGEWTFSGVAFPDFDPEHEVYMNLIFNCAPFKDHPCVLKPDKLWKIRQQAEEFIPETAEKILALKPKIVGCGSMFLQHCASLALLRYIKEKNSKIVTVMGGCACEGSAARVIKQVAPWVDFVFSGEADLLFPEFCETLLENEGNIQPNKLSAGIISSKTISSFRINPKEPPTIIVDDLDTIPIPDFEDYFEQKKQMSHRDTMPPFLPFETSRGCWWYHKAKGCTFCAMNSSRGMFRSKSPDRIMKELRTLYERHSISLIKVSDDILNMKWFDTLLPRLAEQHDPEFKFHFEIKANLKEEQVKQLADANTIFIQPGIESLHDEALKAMNKGVFAIDNVALLKFALENGIGVQWNFLFGLPGEKEKWYEEIVAWLPMIRHLQAPSLPLRIYMYRNSYFWHNPEQFGLELIPRRFLSYIFPLSEQEMNDFAFWFEDKTDIERDFPETEGIRQLKKQVFKWISDFNAVDPEKNRPKLIFRTEGNQTFITDTRPDKVEPSFVLKDDFHHVHTACRKPTLYRHLGKKVRDQKGCEIDATLLDEIVQFLRDKKLLLEINGRLLSLATLKPRKPIITQEEFLSGNVVL